MKSSRFLFTSVFFLFCVSALTFRSLGQITADKTSGCLPLVVSFNIGNSDIENIAWQTQDGQTSTTENPTFIFENAGSWEVTADITLKSGEVENLTYQNLITVYEKPQVDFSIEENATCLGQSISFNNLTAGADSYVWSFGDGNQSTLENPSHQYEEPGVYSVTLTAQMNGACQEMKVEENAVNIEVPENVSLNASRLVQCMTDSNPIDFSVQGDLSEIQWDFGDGSKAEGASVNHFYNSIGEYQVSVSYVNELGCFQADQLQSLIVVEEVEAPTIEVNQSSVCQGGEVAFKAVHSASTGFLWEIDGEQYDGKEVIVSFNQAGEKDVSLTFTDESTCSISVFQPSMINVQEVEPVAIDYEQTAGCAPYNFTAINNTEGGTNFRWRVNGETLTGSELNYTFENQGQFQIVAITEYESGCEIETILGDEIQVFESESEVGLSDWRGCAPFNVDFELLNEGVSNVQWNFEGNEIEGSSVNYEFQNAGIYYPIVSYINEFGCEVEYVLETPISVLSTAILLDEPEVIQSCTYTQVQFNGDMGYEYWEWDFGDGTISTERDPSHSYSEPGTYEVSLTTSNKNGCEAIIERYTIIEIPNLDVTTSLQVTAGAECGYFSATLQAALAEGQNAKWYYDENLIGTGAELSVSFISLADVGITLRIGTEGECTKSKAIMIPNPWEDCENPELEDEMEETEGDSPIGKFEFSSCTFPYSIDLVNPIPGASKFQWKYENGENHSKQNFTETFSDAGEYTIGYWAKLDSDSIVWVEDYITVIIYQSEIDFDYELKKVCDGFEITLNPLNPNFQNYRWKLNNRLIELSADQSYLIEREGLHSISLDASDQNNCETTRIKNIYVGNQENRFNFSSSLCLGEGVSITHSLAGFEEIKWDMGDGQVVDNFDSPYMYNEAGDYSVTALAKDVEGCEYVFELPQEITVLNPMPEFRANRTESCGVSTINFQNLSEGATEWNWNFGNGVSSAEENPEVTFLPGTYSVSLTAINGNCSETVSKSDYIVIQELTSDFTFEYDQPCLPVNIEFEDASINAVSWYWEFGDGTTSTEQNPSHTFFEVPNSNVKLTVQNASGCSVTKRTPMDFIFSASFEIDANAVCLGNSIQFSAVSENAVNWLWDFGDGVSSTERDPIHTYESEGIYDVMLIAESAEGCNDTVFMEHIIEVIPAEADFELVESISSNCVPVQVRFNDLSKGADTYYWDFGDGKTSRVASPTHLYSTVGDFDVTLVITNELGCTDTLRKEQFIQVNGPKTEFEIDDKIVCLPNTANFTDVSESAVEWLWIFGDGNTSTEQNPQHLYENPGVYEVTLIAKNQEGCEQNFKMENIKVLPTPQVDFDMEISGECYPVEVKLTNNSHNLLNPSYLWNFGDGQTSTEKSPIILIEKTGEFAVSLTVENDGGCPVELTHENMILVRDTVRHVEADLNRILVEEGNVQFELRPFDYNNISHYNVYRDSPSGFNLLQTIPVEGQASQRMTYDDDDCSPQDMSHKYIFQAVPFCEDTVSKGLLTVYNTLLLTRQKEQEDLRKVDWNMSLGFTIDNQRIFRKVKGEEQWNEIAVVEADALSFLDEEDLCPGIYEYRVGAFEQNTLRSISNYIEYEVTDEIYVNQIAEIQNSTVMETGDVFIEWSIPEEGKDRISNFEIYRSENGGEYEYFDSVEPHEQFYIDKEGDTESSSYKYQVKIINDCSVKTKNSAESNTVLLQKDVQFRKYELRWNAFQGWEEGVDKYIIQRLNENGEWETVEEVPAGNQLKTIIRDTKD